MPRRDGDARRGRDPLPHIRSPMLATLVEKPFDDPAWLFETKWDGVRAICTIREDRSARVVSRTGHDLLTQFPELLALGESFRGLPVIIDGEIVSLDKHGLSSFQRLQGRLNRQRPDKRLIREIPVKFEAFDLLYVMGHDLRGEPLERRKTLLKSILAGRNRLVRLSRHRLSKGTVLFAEAKRRSWEGIIGKRRDSPYRETRSRDWVKIKAVQEQEFVIGGWTEPKGSRAHFGALLVGHYDDGKLQFAGHVGTGFNRATLNDVMLRLSKIAASKNPFAQVPPLQATKAHWVRPQLVAQVKFGEWTRDGILRQPVFLGLRKDKKAKDVVRERPVSGS